MQSIIDDLKAGRAPQLSSEDFPCFSAEALAGNNHVAPDYLDVIAKSLTEADIPTFERAIRAVGEGDLAWLGFKVIYDAAEAQRNTDNEVTKKYGDQGSADGEPLVFFCNDAKEIVSSRTPSPRDTFQMKDVTRGPSMHNEQFEGLTWRSVALFDQYPGKGAQLVRAAGVAAQLMAKENGMAQIRLPSGEVRYVRENCKATIGQVGNTDWANIQIGKAGRKRHMGWRPTVRGSVMNPNDHPHGGGEGKSPVGRPGPVTPWGKPALGYKTRKTKNRTDKFIVKRRNAK